MSRTQQTSRTHDTTLVGLLRRRAGERPDQRAYTFLLDGEDDEATLTHAGIDTRARAIAAQLLACTTPGERALLLYPPGLDFVAAFWGCLYAGVIAVPALPPDPLRLDRTLPRLRAIIHDAEPLVILTTTQIVGLGRALLNQETTHTVRHWIATDTLPEHIAEAWHQPPLTADSLAFLQYTSGSTATPRGVMVTHGNLLHNLAIVHAGFRHTSQSLAVIWLPPYHDMGLIGGILQPPFGGFPVVLMSPFAFLQRPIRWLRAVSRYRATTSGGPNFAYDLCVRKITPAELAALDLRSWQVAFNGAEPVRHETIERFSTMFAPCGFQRSAFYPCYGLAEATLMVTGARQPGPPPTLTVVESAQDRVEQVADSGDEHKTLVSCGHSWLGQTVVIAHPTTGHACGPDEIGEIWVAGGSVAAGYWHQPQATRYTFDAYLTDSGAGPFLRTGDLGFLHGDELYVTGRLKDLIIIDGRNLYPQDIELTAERAHPLVRAGACAAFSVNGAGPERLIVVAEVDRRQLSSTGSPTTPDVHHAVTRAVRTAVAQQHDVHVHQVTLLKAGTIPKTSSGKLQRHACRAGFLAGTLDLHASDGESAA
jgi:acyl-CoA synthetase (AMP-forming)/AMP-acid ligase II